MKKLIFLVFFLVSAASALEIATEYDYDRFCEQFGRNYEGQEYENHKAIFDANYAALLEAVANGKDRQVTNFMDWNQTQKSGNFYFNLAFFNFNPENLQLNSPPPPLRTSLTAVPPTFNWADLGMVTPARDQGSCGACWAFSTTAVFESLILILGGS